MTNSSGAIKAASRWWEQALANPKFDNGSDDSANRLARMLAKSLAVRAKARVGNISAFCVLLEEKLKEELKGRKMVLLDVDYHPGRILSGAAREVGLSDALFPWKTTMRVSLEEISVSYGYGSPNEILWRDGSFDKKGEER